MASEAKEERREEYYRLKASIPTFGGNVDAMVEWATDTLLRHRTELTAAIHRAETAEQELAAVKNRSGAIEMQNNQLREALAEARQTCKNVRESSANALQQLELIANGEHPRYWTLEKGDVLFRIDGERIPQPGDYVLYARGSMEITDRHRYLNPVPIYRRIEAPSEASASPPPVSAQPGRPSSVDHKTEPGHVEARIGSVADRNEVSAIQTNASTPLRESSAQVQSLPVSAQEGERYRVKFGAGNGGHRDDVWFIEEPYKHDPAMSMTAAEFMGDYPGSKPKHLAETCAAYLNGTSPEHATIREQAAEIERLRKQCGEAFVTITGLREENVSLRAQLQQAKECQRCEARYTRMLMLMADCGISLEPMSGVGAAKCWRASMQGETWSFHSAIDAVEAAASNYDARKATPSQPSQPETEQPAPAAASEGSKRTAVEAAAESVERNEIHHNGKTPEEAKALGDAIRASGKPATPAPAAESGKVAKWSVRQDYSAGPCRIEWETPRENNGSRFGATADQAFAAADWLNRRTEIEQQLAQLKQQAEAWEKDHRAMEAMRRRHLRLRFTKNGWAARWDAPNGEYCARYSDDPADSALQLRTYLEDGE